MPSGFAAQSRQRYGDSSAGRKRLRHLRFLFGDLLHVVQELEKHDAGQHGEPVEITVEPLSLRMMSRQDFTIEESR